MSDYEKALSILKKNTDKGFVKRILNKENSPVLDNGDGTVSTHSMSWGEADGRYFVYPTVLVTGDGTLKRFSNKDAWRNVMKTGNYIEFDSPEEADWFSRRYKSVWGE